ncbi:MAG TPA: hypothetical protein DIC52_13375 [Candidatus Latescibacteria bacterium]|nr:hypothetical protein [Candidatus Latescibacterota bacterium]
MSNDLAIRAARLEDAELIAQFNCALALETEEEELDLPTVTRGVRRFLQGAGFYLVAEIDARVIGCLMITHEWSDWRDSNLWWIQSVYVHSEARRRGVFRALFAAVSRRAEADGDVRGHSQILHQVVQIDPRALELGRHLPGRFQDRNAPRYGVHEDLGPTAVIDLLEGRQQGTEIQCAAPRQLHQFLFLGQLLVTTHAVLPAVEQGQAWPELFDESGHKGAVVG